MGRDARTHNRALGRHDRTAVGEATHGRTNGCASMNGRGPGLDLVKQTRDPKPEPNNINPYPN